MGTDLNAPLGQDRKPGSKIRKPRIGAGRLMLALGLVALAGISGFVILSPSGLQTVSPVETASQSAETASSARKPSAPDQAGQAGRMVSGGQAGANVRETTLDDGSRVTTYAPKPRDGEGPAIIEVQPGRGQDPRMAAFPNESLLEETPDGRLPIVGPDGLRPMDHYARPWSGARGTRIALVVGGLGLSQSGTQNAIRTLPADVTLAFAASGNSLERWMQEARREGHEILLQVPLEPFDYPTNDPGPNTLLTSMSARANLDSLHVSMARLTNYTGIMNFLGGRFLSDADALEPILRDISRRGLLFLDDGTSAQSLSGTIGKALDLPHGFADMTVDTQLDRMAILRKLDELEKIARQKGTAIGTASAFDESVAAIGQWMKEAEGRGIEFVGVSALVDDPKQEAGR